MDSPRSEKEIQKLNYKMSEKFKSLIFLLGTSIYRARETQTHLALVLDHRKLPDTCNVRKLFLMPVASRSQHWPGKN